jgi:hypothetical protein
MADSNPLINSIAAAVGVEKETVIQCLRPSLYGLFGKPISQTGSAALKFPGLWRRWEGPSDRHRFSQYCPICLLQSGHHQLSWTIGIYSCCVQHRCFLQQRCPHCGKLFRAVSRLFRSSAVKSKMELQLCAHCGRSVVNGAPPSELADNKSLKLTCVLGSLVRNSSCRDFFDVLARLLYVMCRSSALARHMRSQLLSDSLQITCKYWSSTPTNFKYLDVKSRAYMLQAVVSLFADWPNYLIEVLRSANQLGQLLKYKRLPSWYERAVRVAMTKHGNPKPSDRDKFLRAATQQGWITVVQFAEDTRNTGSAIRIRPA